MVGKVTRGDERKLSSWWVRRAKRTLLVVYPEGDLLERSLGRYDGDVVLFVGEGRGGVNGVGTSSNRPYTARISAFFHWLLRLR